MATDVTLYIGMQPLIAKYRFADAIAWERVRVQIVTAMNAGRGLIELDHKGDKVVYVYSPYLPVSWVESGK
ncbi:hypothetical protein JOD63_001628 [Microbacterium terrae]|uniref:Uncharacterized protein n=1 Tax=Microbacterium terrae TaxID=69369 RepID=A0A0M2H4Q7_9MICO|nr:hypothetical protein [Microbacterium terrae]KJL41302.1 hypothetical protein RS81_01369 [Microbacterium terrae]MBP1077660.1 hypothetical protein [Microbacterium terrae]GLJ99266.1 hypothetical protein GCM10017594_24630 [Microbacterium terrae]